MRYAQIRKYDVANGPGIRTTFFVTGCHHNCKNCFNKVYQDPSFGEKWTDETTREVISYLLLNEVEGLTVLGGEPFENIDGLIEVLSKIKEKCNKSIWVYTGFIYEYLINNEKASKLLNLIDVLVDGPFIEEQKDLTLKFRGSANQRVIDVKKSQLNREVIILDGYI